MGNSFRIDRKESKWRLYGLLCLRIRMKRRYALLNYGGERSNNSIHVVASHSKSNEAIVGSFRRLARYRLS